MRGLFKMVLCCLLVLIGTVNAQVIYQDNFDSYSANSAPPGWTLLFSGYGTQYQVVAPTNNPPSPPNSYKLEGACNWASTSYHLLTSFPDKVRLDLRVKVDNPLSECLPYQDAIMGFFNYPNHASTMYGVGFAAGMVGGIPFQYDTWYSVRVELDKSSNTYSTWFNNQQVILAQTYSGSDPNAIFLTAHNKGHTRVWYDDIQVTDLGEDEIGPNVTLAQVTTLASDFLTSGSFWLKVKATDLATGNSNVVELEYIFGTSQGQGDPAYRQFDPKLPSVEQQVIIFGMPFDATTLSLRARDEAGNWGPTTSLSVSVLRSGFDPRENGFRFTNPPNQCNQWTIMGTTIGGFDCCTGVAMTAVDFFRNGKSADVQLADVLSTIQTNHKAGILKWLKQAFEIIFGNPNHLVEYNWIRQQITGTPKEPALVWLMGGSQGVVSHVVVAAAVLELSNQELGDQRVIAVYDPNRANFTTTMTISESGSFAFETYDYTKLKFLPYKTHFFGLMAQCPVDISLSDPLGRTIDSVSSEIPDAFYAHLLSDEPPDTATVICVYDESVTGRHIIRVASKEGVSSDSLFSLFAYNNDSIFTLANEMQVGDIPVSGYSFFTGPWASISGRIEDGLSHGLVGVNLDVYDAFGTLYQSFQTDEEGYYHVDSIPSGDYSILAVTPFGYNADQETKEFNVNHVPATVDFTLTKLDIIPNQRPRSYWVTQVQKALAGTPRDYTLADFSGYAAQINRHFNENRVNQVDFYLVPQPATQTDSLELLRQILTMTVPNSTEPFLKKYANAELMAVMLNVIAGKISQTQVISLDNRTVSQAITYCDYLINGIPSEMEEYIELGSDSLWPYRRAQSVAYNINTGQMVSAGKIPAEVVDIAYRDHVPVVPMNLPTEFELKPNHPNPFNPVTTIEFSLPKASDVLLEVYNIAGQKVATLVNSRLEAGNHSVTWDSRNDSGQPFASGIYLYRLKAGEFVDAKKMMLLK